LQGKARRINKTSAWEVRRVKENEESMVKKISWMSVLGAIFCSLSLALFAGGDVPTEFSNSGGITNTRHNLTQGSGSIAGITASLMDPYRNDYGQVCVYCHTPHGANSTGDAAGAPLWNRTVNTGGAYSTYDTLGTSTITSAIGNPGAHSLTCLSCHDGTIAIDSIINQPGSGRYQAVPNEAFLDQYDWNGNGAFQDHTVMGTELGGPNHDEREGCMSCHSPGLPGAATDFSIYVIGTNLTNDHPVGIGYPTARVGVDFNAASNFTGSGAGTAQFYGGDSNMNDSDVRFYYRSDIGSGEYAVECASCHDPHGVEATPGGTHLPTFLRKTNAGSALCQTCHNM
jgi:mono/diheme cytochrome c family protein